MDLKLTDKLAFVSGSTAGIGLAVAKNLLQEGAQVAINGRTQKTVDQTVAMLKQAYPKGTVFGIAADFSHKDSVQKIFDQLPAVDILINNVGIYKAASFFETKDEDWQHQFEVNIMSGVRLSRYYLPKMLHKNWGRVLFVSSECASLVPPDLLAYSTTKMAVVTIAKGLAQTTKGSGVTVNAIVPGSTLSEGAQQFLNEAAANSGRSPAAVADAFFKEERSTSLLQRFASVAEVANTMTYLVSPLSAATNGAAIRVDGGSMGTLL